MQLIRTFRREPAEVSRSRRFVADALERSGRHPTDAVMLVTSELVSNAVMHGTDPVELHLALDDERLHLEVVDAGGVVLGPHAMPDALALGGRGLPLVDALTQAWGSERDSRGRTMVWADLSAPPLGAPETAMA
jgi:anti-sigma regulatory factor (Ser/Thr protein kinase)